VLSVVPKFDNLAETLLRGGIAPRHVRRYLAELREHLQDLTQHQRKAGYHREDAAIRARALLGSDEELAAAMLEQKQFRSWAARAPWAVFIPLPPIIALLASRLIFGSLAQIGGHYGFLANHAPLPPLWYQVLATDVTAVLNLFTMPLTAALFVALAARQRLKPIWPLAATLLLLVLFIHSDATFAPSDPEHGIVLGFAPIFENSAQDVMLEHWPLVMVQYLLTLVPCLWLLTRRQMTQSKL
jgi:hypothetical protein